MVVARKKTILVVDDDRDSRTVLSQLFRQEGYRVVLARNGQEAVGRTQVVVPDLIVLDLRMPVMDGRTFAALLRKRPALFAVPVVAITAFGVEEVGDIDVDLVLHKPIDFESMLSRVEELVTRGRAKPRLAQLNVLNGSKRKP